MPNKRLTIYLIIINILVINIIFVGHILQTWPYMGHDYAYFIPRLLDTHLFLVKNGFAIQWYTPSFGGGLPAYPNPQHLQFSLVQLLLFIMNPVSAILISTVIYVGVGFAACYLLLSRVFILDTTSSILGAVFFSANGFIIERMAIGHLGYQTFPLLSAILWIALDRSIRKRVAIILLAGIVSIMIHQAGFYLLVSIVFSVFIMLALGYLFNPAQVNLGRVFLIFLGTGLVAALLSASKLSAIYSFMRFFPREMNVEYETTGWLGMLGLFLQLLGTMNLVPLFFIAGIDLENLPVYMRGFSGTHYGYWEFDTSLSSVIFIILLFGITSKFNKLKRMPGYFAAQKRWVVWLVLITFIWITVEFILGKGWIYSFLESLPILNSLHARIRFTSSFLLPIAFVATVFYNTWLNNYKWSPQKRLAIFGFTNILALLPLFLYLSPQMLDFQIRNYDASGTGKIYRDIQLGEVGPISSIAKKEDALTLAVGISHLQLYEPIFGYKLENFHPEVEPGSVWDEQDGFYNMTNPSGYVFPTENNTRPFERIRASEELSMNAFTKNERTTWKIATYQIVSNWVSTLTLCLLTCVLVWEGIKSIRKQWLPLNP